MSKIDTRHAKAFLKEYGEQPCHTMAFGVMSEILDAIDAAQGQEDALPHKSPSDIRRAEERAWKLRERVAALERGLLSLEGRLAPKPAEPEQYICENAGKCYASSCQARVPHLSNNYCNHDCSNELGVAKSQCIAVAEAARRAAEREAKEKEAARWPDIKLFMDGDHWCATRHDFVNLQVSLAGFGFTKEYAVAELYEAERREKANKEAAAKAEREAKEKEAAKPKLFPEAAIRAGRAIKEAVEQEAAAKAEWEKKAKPGATVEIIKRPCESCGMVSDRSFGRRYVLRVNLPSVAHTAWSAERCDDAGLLQTVCHLCAVVIAPPKDVCPTCGKER